MENNLEYDNKIINSIRALSIDMIDNAGSGHPGICLGAAPIIYTLYKNHLRYSLKNPKWINRDRFILSAGHGSALLYSTLFFSGYNYSIEDLKQFRKLKSKTPGHPEYNLFYGIETTTGPLGQGFATAVGMAIGETHLGSKLNKHSNLIDYYTYVLCSDGDLMEGISYESASLAGTLKLDKLIVLYDSNNISLDGSTSLTFTENVIDRFNSMNWHTQVVLDGTNIEEINNAINNAKNVKDKPSIIEIKTIIGLGSKLENNSLVHGSPLDKEDIKNYKEIRNINLEPFNVSNEHLEYFRNIFNNRNEIQYQRWLSELELFNQNNDGNILYEDDQQLELDSVKLEEIKKSNKQMREINKDILELIDFNINNIVLGSADLASSTKLYLQNDLVYSYKNRNAKNIFFGVREHSMGAISNGLALSNLRPICSTFLVFSDYLKPAMRLSSIMELPITYVFTHDNISIGADGRTHQPVEQLVMLRSMPNMYVYRPADANELIGSWKNIINSKNPSSLIVSRGLSPLLKNSSDNIEKGAYIIKREKNRLSGIIISTGTEVNTAIEISNILEKEGYNIRVVSVPCMELFEEQDNIYKREILPIGYKTFVIEYSSSFSWYNYVYNKNYLITLDEFGESGSKDELYKYFNIDIDSIVERIKKQL